LGPGEIPRVSVVSLTKSHATVVLNHLIGRVQASPVLRGLIAGEPKYDSVFLTHPTGRLVEICVVPLDRAGGSVVARWSAGCIMDEAPRMQSEDDGVENYDEVRRAVFARLRPGAQLMSVGSPWAPRGSIYKRVLERFGAPGPDVVIMKASGPAMNKYWWTAERIAEVKRADPIIYRTDVLAEFADPEANLFTADLIDKCTRKDNQTLAPNKNNEYRAAMDPATRGNSWPFIIATQEDGVKKVVLIKQWTGSRATPLNPEEVLKEMAVIALPYGIEVVATDQFGGDTMAALARRHGLLMSEVWINKEVRYEIFDHLYRMMVERRIELPDDPALRSDLLSVRKRVTTAGVDIVLPRTGDGRHADTAFALALVMRYYYADPVVVGPKPGTDEYEKKALAEDRARIVNGRVDENGQEPTWWDTRPQ
jgi:hypothetical protein